MTGSIRHLGDRQIDHHVHRLLDELLRSDSVERREGGDVRPRSLSRKIAAPVPADCVRQGRSVAPFPPRRQPDRLSAPHTLETCGAEAPLLLCQAVDLAVADVDPQQFLRPRRRLAVRTVGGQEERLLRNPKAVALLRFRTQHVVRRVRTTSAAATVHLIPLEVLSGGGGNQTPLAEPRKPVAEDGPSEYDFLSTVRNRCSTPELGRRANSDPAQGIVT
jgi:hypothetical protein